MSALAELAIVREGLRPILDARRNGDLEAVRSMVTSLEKADLLAVGALADVVREEEAGGVVRVYANVRPEPSDRAVEVHRGSAGDGAGMQFLRAVAIARITGPRAAQVRVDWAEVGIELAQVALGFGASELVGPIANKRGLAIADDATKKVKGEGMVSLQAMKQRELAGLVRRSGRLVEIIGPQGAEPEPPPYVPPADHADLAEGA
jgi:2-iminoacetate synthase ThiH